MFQELRRQASWHDASLAFFHYRDRDGTEVDIVIERGARAVAGIEVKAAATVTAADFRGLRKFREVAGKRFVSGVVLYDGQTSASFGDASRDWAFVRSPSPCARLGRTPTWSASSDRSVASACIRIGSSAFALRSLVTARSNAMRASRSGMRSTRADPTASSYSGSPGFPNSTVNLMLPWPFCG